MIGHMFAPVQLVYKNLQPWQYKYSPKQAAQGGWVVLLINEMTISLAYSSTHATSSFSLFVLWLQGKTPPKKDQMYTRPKRLCEPENKKIKESTIRKKKKLKKTTI